MKNIDLEDNFKILRKIFNNPKATQRSLASDLVLALEKLIIV